MNEPINFFANTCPLTCLPLYGRGTVDILGSSKDVLYTFSPIGQVIFPFETAIKLTQLIRKGKHKPRFDLAGLTRQATERGEPQLVIGNEIFGEPRTDVPTTFEDKRLHFLRLLYDTGGNEYRKRTIHTFYDFPMAFAASAEQFDRILKSLLDEDYIKFAKNQIVQGDWKDGLLAHYHDVLPTANGKRFLDSQKLAPIAVAVQVASLTLSHLHPTIQQAAGTLYATGHYRQALLDAFIAVDNAVREKSQLTGSGTRLMEVAFSPGNPVLKMGDSPDEQQGFMALFRGAMLAIRNPKAHSLNGTHDAQRALEWLGFASVLLRNLDEAVLNQPPASPTT